MAENNPILDATNISFEELLNTEYIPASHIANKVSKASSAVSVVTAQEIKDYGYRSLGEILGSMRGIQVFQDYEYTFLGGRGFSKPGEYAGRIAVLIDGYRADDSMYGQAYLGHDGILDVSIIDRVEYIPGGGSSGYSSGALLGVINIITKKGSDIDGTSFAYGYGSHNSKTQRVAFGKNFDSGFEILFDVSKYDSKGRDFTYHINGVDTTFTGQNREKNHRIFLKASYDNISLETGWVSREKNIPSYSYAGVNSEDSILQIDKNRFTRVSYDKDFFSNLKLSTSFWSGEYHYFKKDIVSYSPDIQYYLADSKWYGGDIKLVSTSLDNHILYFGSDYRSDYGLRWTDNWVEVATNTENLWIDDYKNRQTHSFYGYDEFKLTPYLNLNYGLRYEKSYDNYHSTSPQMALIWQARKSTLLKLTSQQTYRHATVDEGNSSDPEKVKTMELVLEETLGEQTKLLTSLYHYHISNNIEEDASDIITNGIEFEFEKHWQNATRMKMSYSYQNAKETNINLPLVNSPKHLAKLNLSVPLINERLRMGLEMQYVGKRLLEKNEGSKISSHTLTNLTFTSHGVIPNCDFSFHIHNLMDKKYANVVSQQMNGDLYYLQDGRTFWFEMEYKF